MNRAGLVRLTVLHFPNPEGLGITESLEAGYRGGSCMDRKFMARLTGDGNCWGDTLVAFSDRLLLASISGGGWASLRVLWASLYRRYRSLLTRAKA